MPTLTHPIRPTPPMIMAPGMALGRAATVAGGGLAPR
jgi:hypothetical protein